MCSIFALARVQLTARQRARHVRSDLNQLAAINWAKQVFYELPSSLTANPTRVKGQLVYYAFDLLYLDGFDLRGAALIDRKRVLEALLDNTSGVQLIRYVDHIRR